MSIIVSGKVWKFGDDINTDYMAPSFEKETSLEAQKKKILHIHKGFVDGSQPGDVIVAGKNFGCGSSRENAPANLRFLGIGCVVAESFGRIFFRNCLAIAFPVMACKGVHDLFEEGDQLELDFENSMVKNLTRGAEIKGPPLSSDLINIVKKGGILKMLARTDG
jgi:3-isopropylmalate/(R)-2-methylmalate dehydratase small subunit